MLRDFILWLNVVLWKRRLEHARRYRVNIERVLHSEVRKAQHDLSYCETMAARARMARVETRADRNLARGRA